MDVQTRAFFKKHVQDMSMMTFENNLVSVVLQYSEFVKKKNIKWFETLWSLNYSVHHCAGFINKRIKSKVIACFCLLHSFIESSGKIQLYLSIRFRENWVPLNVMRTESSRLCNNDFTSKNRVFVFVCPYWLERVLMMILPKASS